MVARQGERMTPGWVTLQFASATPAVIALLVLVGLALATFYRAPRSRVLPALRAMALVVVVLSLLRPAVIDALPEDSHARSRVKVLIDDSPSMQVVDSLRAPHALVPLADWLKMLPEGARDESLLKRRTRLHELRQAFEQFKSSQVDADLARSAGRGVATAQERFDVAQQRVTRLAEMLQIPVVQLSPETFDAEQLSLAALIERSDAELYASNKNVRNAVDGLSTLSRGELAHRIASELSNRNRAEVTVTTTSDLPAAMRDESPASDASVVGITDGAMDLSQTILHRARGPMHLVNIGDAGPARDVCVDAIDVPDKVYVGQSVETRVRLHSTGVATADVAITFAGQRHLQQTTFAEGRATVSITSRVDAPGTVEVSAEVVGVEDDVIKGNDSLQRWIRAVGGEIKVGAYAGGASWDYQYVRDLLSRTPWVELTFAMLPPGAQLPLDAEQVRNLDALLLFDVDPASLSRECWVAATEMVEDRGGAIVLAAGNQHVPQRYGQSSLTLNLLPYGAGESGQWQTWPGEDPGLHLREAGDFAAFVAAGRTAPPLYRLYSLGETRAGVTPLLVEQQSGRPVVTDLRLGNGHSFFVGTDETWRWRRSGGKNLQDVFWLNLLARAVGEPYAVRSTNLELDTDVAEIREGGVVNVRARKMHSFDSPPRVNIATVDGAGAGVEVQFTRGSSSAGTYHATVEGMRAGKYELVAEEGATRLPLLVTPRHADDLRHIASDQPKLERWAQDAGAVHVGLEEIDQMDRLVERSIAKPQVAAHEVQRRLWDSPYLFLMVVALLTIEWSVRKRAGLA